MGSPRRPSASTPGQAGTPLRAGTFPRPRGERRRRRPPLLPPHHDSPAGTNRRRPLPAGLRSPGPTPPPWLPPSPAPAPDAAQLPPTAAAPRRGAVRPGLGRGAPPPAIFGGAAPPDRRLCHPPHPTATAHARQRRSGARSPPPPPSPTAAPAIPPAAPPSPGDLNMLMKRPPEALWRGREAVTWGGDVSFGGGPRPAQAPLKAGGERGSASVRERKCRGGRAAAGPPETSE